MSEEGISGDGWVSKDWLWLEHPTEVFIPAQISRKNGSLVAVTVASEEVPTTEAKCKEMKRVHPSCMQGISNMIHLEDMSENAILHTLRTRYNRDLIYTHISSILISINPYKLLNIYGKDMMNKIKDRDKVYLNEEGLEEKKERFFEPHPFTLAADAFKTMTNRGEHQSVIISGESGAGKTEATKIILKYLSFLSGQSSEEGVEQQLLEANPIIEAFGNAQTVRNNNSSRFGKWVEIHFDSQHRIIGGSISHYLLEKSRVVIQSPNERNYHIFHQITASKDHKLLARYQIQEAAHYKYIRESKLTSIDGVPDTEGFERTLKALQCLKITEDEIDSIFTSLTAILNLGNVTIAGKSGNEDIAHIDPADKFLSRTAELLGITVDNLKQSLSSATKGFGKDVIRVPFNVSGGKSGRDALAKHLYGKLFNWIITLLNRRLKTTKFIFAIIGILDIFGFEIFETNRLEQLLINFANEKLQKHFNHFVFELEQEEYKAEGLSLPYVEFKDNKDILNMLEQPPSGILPMLDEELIMPKTSDSTFVERLFLKQRGKRHFRKPTVAKECFIIKHYAGDVEYTVEGFLVGNRDQLSDDHLNLIKASKNPFFATLFVEDKEESTPTSTPVSKRPSGGAQAPKRTLSLQFREQLNSLMSKLESTNPHFIRCIKPNNNKISNQFDSQLVLKQLRYAGIEAVIRVRQTGFPFRLAHRDFFQRFKILVKSTQLKEGKLQTDKEKAAALLVAMKLDPSVYGVGRTKIFLTHEKHKQLETEREARLLSHVIILQAAYRSWMARTWLRRLKRANQAIQQCLAAAKGPNARALQDLLQSEFLTQLKSAIEMGKDLLPPTLAAFLKAQALLKELEQKDQERLVLNKVADSKSEDLDVYKKELATAKSLGEDMCSLLEYQACENALAELELELKRREQAARKAAEKAAKKAAKEKELKEKEELEAKENERKKEELQRQELEEKLLNKAAGGLLLNKAAGGRSHIPVDDDSPDSLSESERKEDKQRRELEEKKRRQADAQRKQKEEEQTRLVNDLLKKTKELKAKLLTSEKDRQEAQVKVKKLQAETDEIRKLYRAINEDLFKRLDDHEQYKKRVSDMEQQYITQLLALKEKVKTQERYAHPGGPTAREKLLQQDIERWAGDFKSKQDENVQLKRRYDSLADECSGYKYQISQLTQQNSTLTKTNEDLQRQVNELKNFISQSSSAGSVSQAENASGIWGLWSSFTRKSASSVGEAPSDSVAASPAASGGAAASSAPAAGPPVRGHERSRSAVYSSKVGSSEKENRIVNKQNDSVSVSKE